MKNFCSLAFLLLFVCACNTNLPVTQQHIIADDTDNTLKCIVVDGTPLLCTQDEMGQIETAVPLEPVIEMVVESIVDPKTEMTAEAEVETVMEIIEVAIEEPEQPKEPEQPEQQEVVDEVIEIVMEDTAISEGVTPIKMTMTVIETIEVVTTDDISEDTDNTDTTEPTTPEQPEVVDPIPTPTTPEQPKEPEQPEQPETVIIPPPPPPEPQELTDEEKLEKLFKEKESLDFDSEELYPPGIYIIIHTFNHDPDYIHPHLVIKENPSRYFPNYWGTVVWVSSSYGERNRELYEDENDDPNYTDAYARISEIDTQEMIELLGGWNE